MREIAGNIWLTAYPILLQLSLLLDWSLLGLLNVSLLFNVRVTKFEEAVVANAIST